MYDTWSVVRTGELFVCFGSTCEYISDAYAGTSAKKNK